MTSKDSVFLTQGFASSRKTREELIKKYVTQLPGQQFTELGNKCDQLIETCREIKTQELIATYRQEHSKLNQTSQHLQSEITKLEKCFQIDIEYLEKCFKREPKIPFEGLSAVIEEENQQAQVLVKMVHNLNAKCKAITQDIG